MPRENTKYVIIPLSKVEDVDFDQVMQTSVRYLRLSEDGEYTFVKFEGDTPSFLDGYTQYSNAEMIAILKNADGIWYIDDEEAITWRETVSDFVNTITWSKFNPFNWF
jgi:hypothetical protein|tara:strand:- start:421 stop:744 length:324 start_codon:yes stop_codon:yes gene_type:complete